MVQPNDRSWSCYPNGVLPNRRAFLRNLAAAAAAAGASFPSLALGHAELTSEIDDFLAGVNGGIPDTVLSALVNRRQVMLDFPLRGEVDLELVLAVDVSRSVKTKQT